MTFTKPGLAFMCLNLVLSALISATVTLKVQHMIMIYPSNDNDPLGHLGNRICGPVNT